MTPHPVDAIIVLGAKIWPDGSPSPALRRRVSQAARLFHAGVADYLILTGGVGPHPWTEARVMHRLALEQGVPDTRLILEETALNTLGNAAASARIVKSRRWSKVVVVTDGYHLPRALLAFRFCGVAAAGHAAGPSRAGLNSWRGYYAWLREGLVLPWCLLTWWIAPRRSLARSLQAPAAMDR